MPALREGYCGKAMTAHEIAGLAFAGAGVFFVVMGTLVCSFWAVRAIAKGIR